MIKLNQNFPAKLLDNTRIKPTGSLIEFTNIYITNRRIGATAHFEERY